MRIVKSFAFPALAGALAGMFILWALDSFPQQGRDYFVGRFFESLTVASIVVIMMQLSRKK